MYQLTLKLTESSISDLVYVLGRSVQIKGEDFSTCNIYYIGPNPVKKSRLSTTPPPLYLWSNHRDSPFSHRETPFSMVQANKQTLPERLFSVFIIFSGEEMHLHCYLFNTNYGALIVICSLSFIEINVSLKLN